MKKRALIVPAAFIILSLLCSVFLVGWASPFYYYMRSYSFEAYSSLEYEAPENNSEFTEKMQKLCNYADRLYSITPNESTLELMTEIYNSESYYVMYNYKMPEGYFEKCVKYTKLDMEMTEQTGNLNWQEGPYYINNICSVAKVGFPGTNEIVMSLKYSLALYMNGQTEEAIKELDKCIADFKKRDIENTPVSHAFYRYFFEIAYATAVERGENTDWIIERELEITQFEKANNSRLTDEYKPLENFFLNRSFEELKADNYEYNLW